MNSATDSSGNIIVLADVPALAEEAARIFVDRARQAISARSVFTVALSGGNTPRPLFEKLAASPYADEVNWPAVQIFFSDERFVPHDSPQSNYHMANEALLSRVPLPPSSIHAVQTVDISPPESAARYEQEVRAAVLPGPERLPSFDLILLGMGPDGHTASLFPGTSALQVQDRLVTANFVPKMDAWRISFTYPLLDAARTVLFLVQGADKAEPLQQVLDGSADLPAGRVRPTRGELLWVVDEAAASRVPHTRWSAGGPRSVSGA